MAKAVIEQQQGIRQDLTIVLMAVSKGPENDINRISHFAHWRQSGLMIPFCIARARLSTGTCAKFQLAHSASEGS